ncbi:autotransporter outer membrane beta-barrel domain-containing protein [Diaphorobacter sp. HDW4A]|uniref:autotransporter outer membrane beta-barrel domain-containing protein n=1 Tax=Diaphorobacter sp. HDW4A TaxID=2714924 RepID=UPI00140BBA86|nr:autotransporter outer membrane beta-barrel domain-containing protein [Diaphorobacter sp. HDW4A]QIL81208.1 autotransporter outer membrane beta-barrel domain-containing protein [Diaphorobacter sp. HDW4A]
MKDSSIVMNALDGTGLWSWRTAAATIDAQRLHIATKGDGSNNVAARTGSRTTVDSGQLYSSGSRSVIAVASASRAYLNGNFIAGGVVLGNKRLTNSWNGSPPETAPSGWPQYLEKADWTSYGRPVDAAGNNVEANVAQYVASSAINNYAVLATGVQDAIRLDRDANDTPNTIHMFGAQDNHALFVEGASPNSGGLITSRGTVITTHSPGSAGGRIKMLGNLLIDGNTITTEKDNAHGLWVTGGPSGTLSTPYNASTIITKGAKSHAMRADAGAQLVFDDSATPHTFLPAATSNVSGAGSAVLNSDGTGTLVRVATAQSLAMSMTAEKQGNINYGALAENGGQITFSEGADSGGTALSANSGGVLYFASATTAPDAAGSRVQLNASQLSIDFTAVRIGSLEGDAASAVSIAGASSHLVVGPDNSAGDGSRMASTIYSGTIQGAGKLTVAAGNRLMLATSGADTHTGVTTIGGSGASKALPTNPTASVLSAGAANAFSASSDYVVLSDGAMDANGLAQTVKSLANAGVVSLPANTNPQPTTVLMSSGAYIGNNGTLVLGTQLAGDGAPSDKLVVGGAITGTTQIDVQNLGGAGAQAPVGILVVQGTSPSPANAFALAHAVAVNGFVYRLQQVGNNWYLQTVAAPTITTATPGNSQAVLTIDPPGNLPTGVTVTGYNMNCTPTTGGAAVTANGASPLTMPGMTNGTTYNCVTTATLSDGTVTPQSNTMQVTPPILTPSITGTVPGDTKGTVTIAPPANLPSGVTVKDYTLTCTPATGAPVTVTGSSPIALTGLTNDVLYTCTAIANLSDGSTSAVSAPASFTPTAKAPATTTPVPVMGPLGGSLMSLFAMVLGAAELRRRKSAKQRVDC